MTKKFKRTLSLLVSLTILATTVLCINIPTVSAATSGSCGDKARWDYNATTKTLTISGTGKTADYMSSIRKSPWSSYKDEIQKLVVQEGITEIGNYNFYNCTKLTDVSLPESLERLDGGTISSDTASWGCFQACTALEKITLPNKLKVIENCVFKDCTALKSITFPNSLESLGYCAFADCTSLETVTFAPNGMTKVGENAFYQAGVRTINWGSITDVSMYSFYGFRGSRITFPEQITNIRFRAFAENYNIIEVTIENPDCVITTTNGTDVVSPFAGHQQAVTIYGHSGSTAQTFAEQFKDKYNYTFVSLDACDHAETYEKVSVDATCTEDGTLQTICSKCGAVVKSDSIKALGHEYELVEEIDHTKEDGHKYITEECSREGCGDIKYSVEHQRNTDEDSNLIYTWVDGFYDYKNTATCSKTGYETYTCTVEGCTMISTANREVATFETHVVAKGNHSVDKWTTTKKVTCTENGEEKGTCKLCGEEVTRVVKATGHLYSTEEGSKDFSESIDNTEEDGHIHNIYICQTCGAEIDEMEHIDWVEGYYTQKVINKPRCVINGNAINTCDLCNHIGNVVLPANGEHSWYETSRTEPTCTSVGKIYYACSNEGCNMTKSENIEALGHDYAFVEANSTAPTCTQIGRKYYKCNRCSASTFETIDALGHKADTESDTYKIISKATCETEGKANAVCGVCGESFVEITPALGHDYVEKIEDLTDEGKPGHVLVTPICSRPGCGQRDISTVRHDEWIDGYYKTSETVPSTCNVEGYYKLTCDICNGTERIRIPVQGHKFNYIGDTNILGRPNEDAITADGMKYRCAYCQTTVYVKPNDIIALWNPALINSREITRTGADEENQDMTSYLDANGDGVINAKDYALLIQSNQKYQAVLDNQPVETE